VRLAIIRLFNLEIGGLVSPMGLNLFVTAGITRISIKQVASAALPWTAVPLVFLGLITTSRH
jgi:C4-dicarboxylate transporter DctM subunit